jgi:hypothetical protein
VPFPLDPTEVHSLEDFVAFVRRLSAEGGEAWENPTTERYLEALAAWVEDSFSEGRSPMHGGEVPTTSWSAFAEMLIAATQYE